MFDKKPIQIEQTAEKKCYVCGKTPEQFGAIFDVSAIKDLINQAYIKRNQKINDQIHVYLNELKDLSREVQNYQENLTINDLKQNYGLAEKVAPKYRELIHFIPKSVDHNYYESREEPDFSIGYLRKNLDGLIQEIEVGNYNNIKQFNPDLFRSIKMLKTPNIDSFKIDNSDFVVNYVVRYYDFAGKDVVVDITYYEDEKFVDYFYRNEVDKIKSYGENTFHFKPHKGKKAINPVNVIAIRLKYYLCPICSNLFSEASLASYDGMSSYNDD